MEELVVQAKSIQVFQVNDSVRYRMHIDKGIDAIVVIDGEYVKSMAKYIDFQPSVLIAQVINCVASVDILYTKKKETAIRSSVSGDNYTAPFGAAELQVILRDAKISITRTAFVAGEEYTASDGTLLVHEHDGFSTNIVSIEVSHRTQTLLDRAIDSIFGF